MTPLRAQIQNMKLLSSTRDFELRCVAHFNLEELASFKSRLGCFRNLREIPDQQNISADRRWQVYRLPYNDLVPALILSHSPEN